MSSREHHASHGQECIAKCGTCITAKRPDQLAPSCRGWRLCRRPPFGSGWRSGKRKKKKETRPTGACTTPTNCSCSARLCALRRLLRVPQGAPQQRAGHSVRAEVQMTESTPALAMKGLPPDSQRCSTARGGQLLGGGAYGEQVDGHVLADAPLERGHGH